MIWRVIVIGMVTWVALALLLAFSLTVLAIVAYVVGIGLMQLEITREARRPRLPKR